MQSAVGRRREGPGQPCCSMVILELTNLIAACAIQAMKINKNALKSNICRRWLLCNSRCFSPKLRGTGDVAMHSGCEWRAVEMRK